MKAHRFMLFAVLMSLCTVAFAQSDMEKSDAQKSSVAAVPSEAQKSFATLKSLAGEWEGPPPPGDARDVRQDAHLAACDVEGNALVHELQEAGTPLDATKYDHPVTMFYVDGDQLTLIHYCDAGNRPRMTGKMSPDGKTVEFERQDISGVLRCICTIPVFTIIDANHHTEDWTFMMGTSRFTRTSTCSEELTGANP